MSESSTWVYENVFNNDVSNLIFVLDYINRYAADSSKLLETHEGYHAVSFVTLFNSAHRFRSEIENIDDIFLEKDPKFYESLWIIFERLAASRNVWIKKPARVFRSNQIEEATTYGERCKFLFGTLLINFNYLLQVSRKILNVLHRFESIQIFLSILGDTEFLKKIDSNIITFLLQNLVLLGQFAGANKLQWKKLGCLNILMKLKESYPKFELQVCMIFSNIATDKELQESKYLDQMVYTLSKAIQSFNEGPSSKIRVFDEELNISVETNMKSIKCEEAESLIFATSVLQSLYNLAVNDQGKILVFQKLKETLRDIILTNESEVLRQHAIQILAQLCFNQKILEEIIKDKQLCGLISQLSKDESILWRRLILSCRQISWMVKDRLDSKKNLESIHEIEYDFMISYDNSNSDICHKLKRSLKSLGFKVWSNTDHINGWVVKSATKAIESSRCFLLFVSEKYRQSVECRIEAECAFKYKKWTIPMITQEGYDTTDSWLNYILKSNPSISFYQQDYDQSFRELMVIIKNKSKELSSHKIVSKTTEPIRASTIPLDHKPPEEKPIPLDKMPNLTKASPHNILKDPREIKRKQIESWNPAQVDKWFEDQKVDKSIIQHLSPCTGDFLSQLNQLQLYSPPFFYQLIYEIKNLPNSECFLKFSIALKNMFDLHSN